MSPLQTRFECGNLRITLGTTGSVPKAQYYLELIEVKAHGQWQAIGSGVNGREFSTSIGSTNASTVSVVKNEPDLVQLQLDGESERWTCTESITIQQQIPQIRWEHSYSFLTPCDVALHPGLSLSNDITIGYTYPLECYDRSISSLSDMRLDTTWALPLPFHIWHASDWVAIYGIDRLHSRGTIDFKSAEGGSPPLLRVYYPDTALQDQKFYVRPNRPDACRVERGEKITLVAVLAIESITPDHEPLLEAERMASQILLESCPPGEARDFAQIADGIANYYPRSKLWVPHALGKDLGWFRNMWTHTQKGRPKKDPYFDLGWGEGCAVELITALLRNWQRTRRTDLLGYVDAMSRGIQKYKRKAAGNEPYFDRARGTDFGDFLLKPHVWSHSLGHTGCQLLKLHVAAPDYPDQGVRQVWYDVAKTIACFFAEHQRPNGDIQDGFDETDGEINHKPHRISARGVVCGLWALLGEVSNDPTYTARALKLLEVLSPEITNFEFLNSMVDAQGANFELTDGECAFYALEGFVELLRVSHHPLALRMCKKVAAYAISWIYFYNLPRSYTAIARGGQVCRMPDFPLLFPGGTAKGVEPLLKLAKLTGDTLYSRMALEMLQFIASHQVSQPKKPWHGAIVHALEQYSGKHWGPNKEGQIDTGMSTGNSLAAIEYFLSQLH